MIIYLTICCIEQGLETIKGLSIGSNAKIRTLEGLKPMCSLRFFSVVNCKIRGYNDFKLRWLEIDSLDFYPSHLN